MNQIRITTEVNCIIICIIASGILFFKGSRTNKGEKILGNAVLMIILLLLTDIGDALYSAQQTTLALLMVPICDFLYYIAQQILIIVMGIYIHTMISDYDPNRDRKWLNFVYMTQGICILGITLSSFVGTFYYIDEYNVYHRGPFFLICILLSVIGMAIEVYKLIQYRKILGRLDVMAMLSYIGFPSIGFAIQLVFPGFCFTNLGFTLAILSIIGLHEYKSYLLQKEKDDKLAKSRAYLLNSQIKPHFLFNSLSVIQSLIEDEPETAEAAIGHLSKYLRKNLNLELSEKPISVWEELEFTQNYLYMEKLRFGDKINIRYEVDEDIDFKVPFLSIQTIVENAIRHGIRKRIQGGTVLIRIYEEEKWYKVEILDNGVGFDLKEKNSDSNGVGIKNVQERLKLLCDGHMEVISAPEKGTKASIYIPKE